MMRRRVLWLLIVIGVIMSAPRPSSAAGSPVKDFRLQIPALKIDLPVITAQYKERLGTWDFLPIRRKAGHLQWLPLPGEGGNVVIGAHRELEWRRPGPFLHLDTITRGTEIVVHYGGVDYRYRVFHKWIVTVDDIRPVLPTRNEVLTLITCDSYNAKTGGYDLRLIVRAKRIP